MKKVLVIAAHPDDEILGCGGTVVKHVDDGDEVFLCVATKAWGTSWSKNHNDKKAFESDRVDKCLGVKKRYTCGFPTMTLKNIPAMELNSRIQEVINEVCPDIIYTHFKNDVNEDHRVLFESVLVCARPITSKIEVRCFETLSSTEWGDSSFNPNFFVILNKDQVFKKIKAFSFYESEVKEYPHPRSLEGIENLAKKRGNDICEHYAECFVTVKSFWK